MHPVLEKFLAGIRALHQLDPKNLPQEVVAILIKMSPEELFKTCTQLAVLWHNIPTKDSALSLSGEEMQTLAEQYLQALIARVKESR